MELKELGLDWVSCSPKTAEHTLKADNGNCNELRYVLAKDRALPKPHLLAEYYYLSPVFTPDMRIDYESLGWCIKLIHEEPKWRLSVQYHKFLNLR